MGIKVLGPKNPGLTLPSGTLIIEGTGAPESSITAPQSSLYHRTGTSEYYLKANGSGNTGWYRLYPVYVGTAAPADTTVLWLDTT